MKHLRLLLWGISFALMVFGGIVFFYPVQTFRSVVIVLSFLFIISSALSIFLALKKSDYPYRIYIIISGFFVLLLGLSFLIFPRFGESLGISLVVLVGVGLLFRAFFIIKDAFAIKQEGIPSWWALLSFGAILGGIGIFMVLNSFFSFLALIELMGISLFLSGVYLLSLFSGLKSWIILLISVLVGGGIYVLSPIFPRKAIFDSVPPVITTGTVVDSTVDISTDDFAKFQEDYTRLNGRKNKKGKVYSMVNFEHSVSLAVLDFDELKEFLEDGTGILFFGFPECPWCRALAPELVKIAYTSHQKIYYYNPKQIRNQMHLEDGKIVEDIPTNDEYSYILKKLDAVLPIYKGLDNSKIKRLYVPLVVFLNRGNISGTYTLEENFDPYQALADKEKSMIGKSIASGVEKIDEVGVCSVSSTDREHC